MKISIDKLKQAIETLKEQEILSNEENHFATSLLTKAIFYLSSATFLLEGKQVEPPFEGFREE